MNRIIVLLPFFLVSFPSWGQQKLDLHDIINDSTLQPEKLGQLQWLPDVNIFSYTKGDAVLYIHEVDESPLQWLTLASLNKMLPDSIEDRKTLPQINWRSPSEIWFAHDGGIWTYRRGADTLSLATWYGSAEHKAVNENLDVAFTRDGNLFLARSGKAAKQLTTDGGYEIRYGEAAYRFEFGINKGLFWSENGKRLAFYRIDQTAVTDYPLVNYSTTPATLKNIKYPMNGDSSQRNTIGVYDLNKDKVTYLNTGKPYDQYLTNITWGPASNFLYLVVVNRDQDSLALEQYDAGSGIYIKSIITETNEKYIEPEHGPIFLKRKPTQFLWFSKRSGYQHLYLSNVEATEFKALTYGEWTVTGYLGLNERKDILYVSGTRHGPLEEHLYEVPLFESKLVPLSHGSGVHTGLLSDDTRYLLDTYSSPDIPNRTQLVGTRKNEPSIIHEAKNPLEDYKLGKVRIKELENEDDITLYTRMITPPGFDSTKQYPAIVYVYGGPHIQLIKKSWLYDARLFLYYLAQQGYVVFTLDNRGSANRGLDFEQALFREMGTVEVEDQMVGINYLKSLDFVDENRIGIHGWSYGGFMTLSLMLREPEATKVGVAGGPVTDWRYYEIMYGERYMDRYQDNVDGFAKSRLHNYAQDLKGDLLIIHGMQDDVVVPQHAMTLMQRFVDERKQVDFLPYPDDPHNVRGPDREHLLEHIYRYIETHLK